MFLYFSVFKLFTLDAWISCCTLMFWYFDVVLVYNGVSTTMSRIVNLHFLDLMEAYHCIAV